MSQSSLSRKADRSARSACHGHYAQNGEYAQLSAEIVGLGKRKKADGDVADIEA
jgi:hypothetical protein